MLVGVLQANSQLKYDTRYLMVFADENPDDIKSREILVEYFYKKNDKKNLLKYSQELFYLDKKNKILTKVLEEYTFKTKNKKIASTLEEMLKNKQYTRYLNLYQALVDTKTYIKKQMHVDALYCAIMSENFDLAKKILKRDDLPMSPKLSSIMKILDKKLGSDRDL